MPDSLIAILSPDQQGDNGIDALNASQEICPLLPVHVGSIGTVQLSTNVVQELNPSLFPKKYQNTQGEVGEV